MNQSTKTHFEDPFEYENGFYQCAQNSRFGKLLAHYELYKKITHLPGHVLEFGVHKGNSLIRFATFRELLEASDSRKIFGFDTFYEFPKTDNQEDNSFIDAFVEEAGKPISVEELNHVLQQKHIRNVELVQGNILDTLPKFVKHHPELKIALLHIDVDVYEPSKVILESLVEKMVTGGLVILDDYGTVEGETRAVDEFFGKNAQIKKLPFSHIPSYIEI